MWCRWRDPCVLVSLAWVALLGWCCVCLLVAGGLIFVAVVCAAVVCVLRWVGFGQIGALFLIMGSFVMGFIPVTCEANKALQYVFNFLPSYALGKGLVNVRRRPTHTHPPLHPDMRGLLVPTPRHGRPCLMHCSSSFPIPHVQPPCHGRPSVLCAVPLQLCVVLFPVCVRWSFPSLPLLCL